MADSNSLTLLPPRPTAQPSQDTTASRSQKPTDASDDDSFKNKLEKARKLKAHVAVKKQIAPTAAKPVGTKPAALAKPTAQVADKSAVPSDPAKKPAKAAQSSEDQPATGDENAQDKQTDAQTLPAAEVAVEHPVDKKPVKVSKPTEGKTTGPTVVTPKTAAPIQTPVKASTQNVSADTKPVAKPVAAAGGDSDSDAVGETDAQATVGAGKAPEFGTGKVVASVKGDSKDSSDAESSSDATDGDAATATAGAIALPDFVDATAQLDAAPVKAGSPSATPLAEVVPGGMAVVPTPTGTATATVAGKAALVPTPQAQFVEDNQPKIISSIQGQLMPNGGTMQLRLDPAELGALSVTVHMRDGVMTASFETSNPDATKMLSHSLGQLRAGLEAAGVSVDKIHVEQAPKREGQGNSDSDSKQAPQEQQQRAQQDQQRREMVRRMWQKLAGGDPLDLVA